jgi:hypothetical protein
MPPIPDPLSAAAFVPGLELCRAFYDEAVRPILDRRFPGLAHGAARLDNGSDVLGFDDPVSTDHGWGPRVNLYLAEAEFTAALAAGVREVLADELPLTFRGLPTHWQGGMTAPTDRRPVAHNVGVTTVRRCFEHDLGVDPLRAAPLTAAEWLVLSEQQLRATAAGAVYRDDTGELARARARLRWYPRDVWLYLLAAQWGRIGQEEAFPGRCGHVGDEVGSRVVGARLVRDAMRLGFLMERQYPPYAKWLGTAFARLACAPRLLPLLNGALTGATWEARDRHLAATYEALAEQHNALGLTPPEPTAAGRRYPSRPYLGISAARFRDALVAQLPDGPLRRLAAGRNGDLGNTAQWSDSTDALAERWQPALLRLYREALEAGEGEGAAGRGEPGGAQSQTNSTPSQSPGPAASSA